MHRSVMGSTSQHHPSQSCLPQNRPRLPKGGKPLGHSFHRPMALFSHQLLLRGQRWSLAVASCCSRSLRARWLSLGSGRSPFLPAGSRIKALRCLLHREPHSCLFLKARFLSTVTLQCSVHLHYQPQALLAYGVHRAPRVWLSRRLARCHLLQRRGRLFLSFYTALALRTRECGCAPPLLAFPLILTATASSRQLRGSL